MTREAREPEAVREASFGEPTDANSMPLHRREGISDQRLLAEAVVNPLTRHASLVRGYGEAAFGGSPESTVWDTVAIMGEATERANGKDLSGLVSMMTAQAMSMDAIYTEMARRAAANVGQFPEATERYMRMAMKAQAQSRATVEALAKIVQPREQTVRHVHVDNRGGQAVIAERVQTGSGYVEIADQSHGAGDIGGGAALLGQDASWNGMPVAGGEGEEAVPHARRDEPGCAEG